MKKAVVLRELDALMAKFCERQRVISTELDALNADPEDHYRWGSWQAMRIAATLLGDMIAALRQMK